MTARPEIVELRAEDIPEIAALLVKNEPPAGLTVEKLEARLRWLGSNPSFQPEIPFAWAARAGTQLVGVMLAVPRRFQFAGRIHTAVMSSGFYVVPEARGIGFALFQAYRRYRDRFILYATSANALSWKLWAAAKAESIPGSDHEYLRVIHFHPVVEEALHPRLGSAAAILARPAALLDQFASGNEESGLRELTSPTELPPAPESDGWIRDADYIRWRYFSEPEGTTRLLRIDTGSSRITVAVSLVQRGHRQQVRALMLLDLWGTALESGFSGLLQGLAREFRASADLIALRGLSPALAKGVQCFATRERRFGHPMGWYIDDRKVLHGDPSILVQGTADSF